jgi:hypothetical protein
MTPPRPALPRPEPSEVAVALRSVALWDVLAREVHALRRERDELAALVEEAAPEVEELLASRRANRSGYPDDHHTDVLADLVARLRAVDGRAAP